MNWNLITQSVLGTLLASAIIGLLLTRDTVQSNRQWIDSMSGDNAVLSGSMSRNEYDRDQTQHIENMMLQLRLRDQSITQLQVEVEQLRIRVATLEQTL